MIGTDAEYLVNDAGNQIGTLIYFGGSIQPTVDAALNSVFGSYNICGYVDDLSQLCLNWVVQVHCATS
ncbi:MAG: hypothetical protein HRT35_23970 [Algicola sp.]|nr:hypothetical protein [Algicola sp.]